MIFLFQEIEKKREENVFFFFVCTIIPAYYLCTIDMQCEEKKKSTRRKGDAGF